MEKNNPLESEVRAGKEFDEWYKCEKVFLIFLELFFFEFLTSIFFKHLDVKSYSVYGFWLFIF